MCHPSPAFTIDTMLKDSLIRLVMQSDGVDERELRAVLEKARRAVAARRGGRPPRGSPTPITPRRTADSRFQPALTTW